MVRRTSRAPSVGLAPNDIVKMRNRRKKPYTVQLETIKTKSRKKKLNLIDVHGSAKPRPGFTFLPVGYADLAERCKERSRQLEVEVAVVSAGSRSGANDPARLTHHVHRIGYHFRNDIFDDACNSLGYRPINGKLVRETGINTNSRFEQAVARGGPRFDLIDLTNDSEEEGNRVKGYIRELFPKIPKDDLDEIYKRAWEQGAQTVGNASNLSLSRQVQLATIARIRHTYTDYDKLLRLVSWKEARQIVEPLSLAKLIEWRGEHDNDTEDFDEILRETIVIDDDDDDDDDDSVIDLTSDEDDHDSDTSLEIVQETLAPKDLHMEMDERPKLVSRAAAPPGRKMDRVLPAAMQTRWRDARARQHVADTTLPTGPSRADQVSIPLDPRGNAPRTFVANGVEYTRISSSPDIQQVNHKPAPAFRIPPGGPNMPLLARTTTTRDNVPVPGLGPRNVPPSPGMDHPYHAPVTRDGNPPFLGHLERRPVYPTARGGGQGFPVANPAGSYAGTYAHPPPHHNAHLVRYPMADAQPQPQPQLRRHPSYGVPQQRLESVKPEDRPIPSREMDDSIQARLPPYLRTNVQGNAQQDPSKSFGLQTRPTYQPPVYGQPAYPQMRSQTVAAQPAARPVHGAPAVVQPMSPQDRGPSVGQDAPATAFGMPSPQKYFAGFNNPFRNYFPGR